MNVASGASDEDEVDTSVDQRSEDPPEVGHEFLQFTQALVRRELEVLTQQGAVHVGLVGLDHGVGPVRHVDIVPERVGMRPGILAPKLLATMQ